MASNAVQAERSFRQAYGVTYYRQGKTNDWTAATRRGALLRDVTASGAVVYMTALWTGQSQADIMHATVDVLLEVHPAFGDTDMLIHPRVWYQMRGAARKLADERVRENHSDAMIEHDEDSGF